MAIVLTVRQASTFGGLIAIATKENVNDIFCVFVYQIRVSLFFTVCVFVFV